MAPAKRRPADRAAGKVFSAIEPLESRQFLSIAHGMDRHDDPAPTPREPARAHTVEFAPDRTRRADRRDYDFDRARPAGNPTLSRNSGEAPSKAPLGRPDTVKLEGIRLQVNTRPAPVVIIAGGAAPVPLFVVRVPVRPAPPSVQPPPPAVVVSAPPVAQFARQGTPAPAESTPPAAQTPDRAAPVRPQGAAQAATVVAASPAATTLALARAANEVLSGGPSRTAMVAGVVEGASAVTSVAAATNAILLGTVQGMFSAAVAAIFETDQPEPLYATAVLSAGESSAPVPGAATSAPETPVAIIGGAIESAIGHVVPRRFFHIARIDALAAFNDAMAAFVDESASLPRADPQRRVRAWAITGLVVAADVALLVYWHQSRARKQQAAGRRRKLAAPSGTAFEYAGAAAT